MSRTCFYDTVGTPTTGSILQILILHWHEENKRGPPTSFPNGAANQFNPALPRGFIISDPDCIDTMKNDNIWAEA